MHCVDPASAGLDTCGCLAVQFRLVLLHCAVALALQYVTGVGDLGGVGDGGVGGGMEVATQLGSWGWGWVGRCITP